MTKQPLSDLVLQSIEGNLPPSISSAPAAVRTDLLKMQTLNAEDLRHIARAQVAKAQQDEHFALLNKNQNNLLTEKEQARLIARTQKLSGSAHAEKSSCLCHSQVARAADSQLGATVACIAHAVYLKNRKAAGRGKGDVLL